MNIRGWPSFDTLFLEQDYLTDAKLRRNATCWCGSGKKYKKCHLEADLAAAAEHNAPPVPPARDIFEIRENILDPKQIRSDGVGPSRR